MIPAPCGARRRWPSSALRRASTLAVIALLAAACSGPSGSGSPESASPSGAPSATASNPDDSLAPESLAPTESVKPSAELSPGESAGPTPEDSAPSSAAASSGPAGGCSGSDRNRDFYHRAAAAVAWDVYCAVLPAGWFVDTGGYQLAGGGRLEIAYKGPGGARFELAEGVFCTEGAAACSPNDLIFGDAAFGDRSGLYGQLGGGYALYVDPGQAPMWKALGAGIDEETFVAFCAALLRVDA